MSTLFSKYFIQTFQILILVSTSISIGAIASDEDQEAAPGQSSFVGARSIAKLDNGNVLINNPYYKLEGNRYLLTYQNFDNSAEIGICKLFGYTKHINNEVEFNKSDRHNEKVTVSKDGSFLYFSPRHYNNIKMIQCGNSAVDVPPSEPKPVIVTGDIYHNPDGSISINNPKYLRNGGSHFLSADGDTAYGTCKLFGYKYKIASDSVPAESVKVDKIVFLNYGGLFSQYDKPGDHAVLTSLECRN